jgi:putative tricarboxylic transport membrane protein
VKEETRGLGNAELWGGLAWLAFGLFIAWQGWTLGLGALHEPGSGFAVFWCGVIATLLALSVIVGAVLKGGPSLQTLWAGTRWPKVLLIIAILLVFGFFFEQIGFLPSSIVLLLVLMRFVDPVPWWQALSVAFGASLGIWFVLAKFLQIQLPAGMLASWLG